MSTVFNTVLVKQDHPCVIIYVYCIVYFHDSVSYLHTNKVTGWHMGQVGTARHIN